MWQEEVSEVVTEVRGPVPGGLCCCGEPGFLSHWVRGNGSTQSKGVRHKRGDFLCSSFLAEIVLVLWFGGQTQRCSGLFWLYTKESFLVVLGGPSGMLRIEPGLAAASKHPAVLIDWF